MTDTEISKLFPKEAEKKVLELWSCAGEGFAHARWKKRRFLCEQLRI
jgi:hypothetical protein